MKITEPMADSTIYEQGLEIDEQQGEEKARLFFVLYSKPLLRIEVCRTNKDVWNKLSKKTNEVI